MKSLIATSLTALAIVIGFSAYFKSKEPQQFAGTTTYKCNGWMTLPIYDTPSGDMDVNHFDESATFKYTTTTPTAAKVIGTRVLAVFNGSDGSQYVATAPYDPATYKQDCAGIQPTITDKTPNKATDTITK